MAIARWILAPVLLALFISDVAWATVGPPVKLRVLGAPVAAEAGEALELTILVETGLPGWIYDFTIAGTGWLALESKRPAVVELDAQGRAEFPVSVLAMDVDEPLQVGFEFDGEWIIQEIDLSPLNYARSTAPRPLRSVIVTAARDDFSHASYLKPPAAPDPVTIDHEDDPRDEEAVPSKRADRNIRVHGRFTYQKPNIGGTSFTTIGADGLTVRVYDNDLIGRQLLGSGLTDAAGYYDIIFFWNDCPTCENDPDIVLEFETDNAVVEVETPVWENNYVWQTGEWHNYTGIDLDVGWLEPFYEDDFPAIHILNNIMRTWRWIMTEEGFNTPATDVQWPASGDNAWYSSLFEEIHISEERQWEEKVLSHEYGHHWVKRFGNLTAPDYCNGLCNDVPPFDCNHCVWCQETDHDAYNEGFPDWLGDVIPRSYGVDYGDPSNWIYNFETLGLCGEYEPVSYDDPTLTEGFLAGLLRDIADATQDDDLHSWGIAEDELALGTHEIFTVAAIDEPTTPLEFLDAFKARYPSLIGQFWATARNNGYEIDVLPPPVPTGLYSTSHTVGVASADPTVQMLWDIPVDDASGVAGFSVEFALAPQMPDAIQDISVQNFYDGPYLSPGSYWFNIRTVDRAERWSTSYASHGPLVIDVPEPADLEYVLGGGWDYSLTPRGSGNAVLGNVHVPTTLPGNATSTWWNVAYRNGGTLPTSSGFSIGLSVDAVPTGQTFLGAIAAGSVDYLLNQGPVLVDGGRHTLTAYLDSNDHLAEPDEAGNEWGRQWTWTSMPLTLDAKLRHPAPPSKTAAWITVEPGYPLFYNADGYRLLPVNDWHAVFMAPLNDKDDYDARLHRPASNADEGFETPMHESARAAGCLDALLINRNRGPMQYWDVGIVNSNPPSKTLGSDYELKWINSDAATVGTRTVADFAPGELIQLFHVSVTVGDVGGLHLEFSSDADAPITVLWLDDGFTSGTLSDFMEMGVTDGKGGTSFDVSTPSVGSYCVAIYRDRKDWDKAGTIAVSATLSVGPILPDPKDHLAVGWYAPLVPRSVADGTDSSVPVPASLPGNVASTYLNLAMRNESPSEMPFVRNNVFVDGVDNWLFSHAPMPGFSNDFLNDGVGRTIPGGRHTLSMHLDELDVVAEIDETNNVYGEQWVWTPLALLDGDVVTRPTPEDRVGGWSDISGGAGAWFNCDGLRMGDYGQTFQAIAIMPGGNTNVDLRLHEVSTSAQDGFTAPLAISSWGFRASDFVLVNFNAIPPRDFDVGVLREGTASADYTAQACASSFLDSKPLGEYGVFGIRSGRVLELHELQLEMRPYQFELIHESGNVDWGISLHPTGMSYAGKSDTVAGGAAWLAGAGLNETFMVNILEEGFYCLAVWKVNANDLPEEGEYRLRILDPAAVDAPVALPVRFAAHASYPNPFNPRTTIRFDLARSATVSLSIHDAKGRLVRVLLQHERFEPGHHRSIWNGIDDRGNRVASGVYYYTLVAGEDQATHPMVLVK